MGVHASIMAEAGLVPSTGSGQALHLHLAVVVLG